MIPFGVSESPKLDLTSSASAIFTQIFSESAAVFVGCNVQNVAYSEHDIFSKFGLWYLIWLACVRGRAL